MLYFCRDGHHDTIDHDDAFEKISDDDNSDTHLDTQDTLSQEHVSAGHVNILIDWVTRVDHKTINKLHSLGSLSSELAADNNLTSLGSRLHDESKDTIAGSSDSKASNQLVTEGLSLGNGAQSTGGNLIIY